MTATLTTQTNASQELLDEFRRDTPTGWWWHTSDGTQLLSFTKSSSGRWIALARAGKTGSYYGGEANLNFTWRLGDKLGKCSLESAMADYMAALAGGVA